MQAGQSLAHYDIIEQIGVGGMGEVWRARDTKLNREVALKFLPAAFTQDAGRHARFRTEAQALAAFGHANVAGVYSFEDVADTHFLVMELAAGDDLSVRLRNSGLSQQVTLEIACQIAMALEAAHAKNIIHRDLKPANIKIGKANEVKVLDFGLAKFYGNESDTDSADPGSLPTVTSDLTIPGAILGTAAYMSPEQARGQTVDKRTDIWAFGCILFEMLTGQLAFPGETVSDTLANLLKAEPQWDAIPTDTHPVVLRLLKRCLSKKPRQRVHDIADVRIEFEDVLTGTETTGVLSDTKSTGSHKYLPTLAVIGWLLVAGLAAWHWLTPPAKHSPAIVKSLTFSGRDWLPNASPDGKTVAFVSDRDGVSRIWLKQLATGNEAPLTAGMDDHPRFSPDGSQVLFVRTEGLNHTAYRMSVVGGKPRKVISDVSEVDWSPDGSQVAFSRGSQDGQNSLRSIGIADAQTGAEREIAHIENRQVYGLRWMPDGRSIWVNLGALTGNVSLDHSAVKIDVESGAITLLSFADWDGSLSGVDLAADGRTLVTGVHRDLLSFNSGLPALVMRYDLDSGQYQELFWDQVRVPRGGWGHSAMTVVNDHQLVFDRFEKYAELQVITLIDGQPTGQPRTLTKSTASDRQPVVSPDGTQVLFSSNRSGNIDLWLANLESGSLHQLTDDPAHDWDPAYSPDGQQIVWSNNRVGTMEIWLSNADGSGARQVSNDGQNAENPTMTRDGQWIVYASSSDDGLGIWQVRTDGTDSQLLSQGSFLLPELSPDGRYCLFLVVKGADFAINVLDRTTGETVDFEVVIPLANRDPDVTYGRARWTPDGTGIVYVGQDEQGRSGIFRQDFIPGQDTRDTRQPLTGFSSLFDTESLGMAPDGGSMIVSAMYIQRALMMVENIDLSGWN